MQTYKIFAYTTKSLPVPHPIKDSNNKDPSKNKLFPAHDICSCKDRMGADSPCRNRRP